MVIKHYMRKITTAIIAMLAWAASAQSQTNTLLSTHNEVGRCSASQEEWIFTESNRADIPIRFAETYISIDNRDESIFMVISDDGVSTGRLKSVPSVTYKAYSWRVRDKRGKTCIATIVSYSLPEMDLVRSIMYEDFCFRFYIPRSQSGIDKLQ